MFSSQAYADRRYRRERQVLAEQLGAFCPHCQSDILDKLEHVALDRAAEGAPPSFVLECWSCKEELSVGIAWQMVMVGVAFRGMEDEVVQYGV